MSVVRVQTGPVVPAQPSVDATQRDRERQRHTHAKRERERER
eukprot:COSAG03_NODE_34757_length_123_cov_413.083333_1_plen_41_part_11